MSVIPVLVENGKLKCPHCGFLMVERGANQWQCPVAAAAVDAATEELRRKWRLLKD